MAQIREIKKRIVAVSNIQRITKTMQMIATAKFTAAVQRAHAAKPYTTKIRQLVQEVAGAAGDLEHPLISGPRQAVKRELLLVISSDRGLCGAYNANVLRPALHHVRDLASRNIDVTVETAGKKAVGFFKFQRIPLAERLSPGDKPAYADIERIARRYIDAFVSGKYDAVRVAYMRFESNARQVPEIMELMPLRPQAPEPAQTAESSGPVGPSYEFSPDPAALLSDVLPTAVKTMLYQAFLDALVSEQILRMVAMKAATENAKDLGKTLRRSFNRARQSQITTELTEIIGGAAALE